MKATMACAVVLSLAGCFPNPNGTEGPPEPSSPAATAPGWPGPFVVDEVEVDCNPRSWQYDVRTRGWGERVELQILLREGALLIWWERHALAEVRRNEDTARHRVDLAQRGLDRDYVSGETTLIPCEARDLVTYQLATLAFEGGRNCIAWGLDPAGEFPDCSLWSPPDP